MTMKSIIETAAPLTRISTVDRSTTFDNDQRVKLLKQGFTMGMIRQLELKNAEMSPHLGSRLFNICESSWLL